MPDLIGHPLAIPSPSSAPARFLDPSLHSELQALIDDLDLEFMGVDQIVESGELP